MFNLFHRYIDWVSIFIDHFDEDDAIAMFGMTLTYLIIKILIQIGISIIRCRNYNMTWKSTITHAIICVMFQIGFLVVVSPLIYQNVGCFAFFGLGFVATTSAMFSNSGMRENSDYSVFGIGYSLRIYLQKMERYYNRIEQYRKSYNNLKHKTFTAYE